MLIPAQLSTFFSRAREDARSPGLCRWAFGLGDGALCKREVTLLRPGSRHPLTRTSTRGRRGRNGVTVSAAARDSWALRARPLTAASGAVSEDMENGHVACSGAASSSPRSGCVVSF